MTLITDRIEDLHRLLEHTGCEEGIVTLATVPDITPCQFERGACVRASFGGKTADFMTENPVRATTRISFMFGRALEKVEQRVAALAIINVVAGFLCISRTLHACTREKHAECLAGLTGRVSGQRVFIVGPVPPALKGRALIWADSVEEADIVLITGDGLAGKELSLEGKNVLFLGPSTAGLCAIGKHPHWCPFGTG